MPTSGVSSGLAVASMGSASGMGSSPRLTSGRDRSESLGTSSGGGRLSGLEGLDAARKGLGGLSGVASGGSAGDTEGIGRGGVTSRDRGTRPPLRLCALMDERGRGGMSGLAREAWLTVSELGWEGSGATTPSEMLRTTTGAPTASRAPFAASGTLAVESALVWCPMRERSVAECEPSLFERDSVPTLARGLDLCSASVALRAAAAAAACASERCGALRLRSCGGLKELTRLRCGSTDRTMRGAAETTAGV